MLYSSRLLLTHCNLFDKLIAEPMQKFYARIYGRDYKTSATIAFQSHHIVIMAYYFVGTRYNMKF